MLGEKNSSITQNIGCVTWCADRKGDGEEARQTEGWMAAQPAGSGGDEIILEEFVSMGFHFLPKSYYLTPTILKRIHELNRKRRRTAG